jgi:hypothetical protein
MLPNSTRYMCYSQDNIFSTDIWQSEVVTACQVQHNRPTGNMCSCYNTRTILEDTLLLVAAGPNDGECSTLQVLQLSEDIQYTHLAGSACATECYTSL